jgi:hypothetical protein
MDPATREVVQVPVALPEGYPYATSRAACVFTNPGQPSLYVEYGGKPWETRGTPKQPPVSAMYAMRLTTPASDLDGWQLARVAGDAALPKLAAAAIACGQDNTAYIFGGMEDRGGKKASVMVPTNTLVKVKVNAGGVNSYTLSATTLTPRGRSPAARSNHVLVYLEPALAGRWGATQGALLLHGGSNLDNTYFNETRGTKDNLPWQKGFQMYSDTWLFDLGRNSWQLLAGVATPVPLMWHSAAVHNGSGVQEVVLFGGTTADVAGKRLDQSVNIMQLDLSDRDLVWRAIPVNVTGGKDTLKTKYLNSGVCTLPGSDNFLLRQQKVSAHSGSCCLPAAPAGSWLVQEYRQNDMCAACCVRRWQTCFHALPHRDKEVKPRAGPWCTKAVFVVGRLRPAEVGCCSAAQHGPCCSDRPIACQSALRRCFGL